MRLAVSLVMLLGLAAFASGQVPRPPAADEAMNGRVVHEATVKTDVGTLLKWAARDNDRKMLYGAELKVTVP